MKYYLGIFFVSPLLYIYNIYSVELHWEGNMTVVCSTEAKDWESSVSGGEVRD